MMICSIDKKVNSMHDTHVLFKLKTKYHDKLVYVSSNTPI